MKETNSNSRVPESKLKELTEAAQIGRYGILTKFLNSTPNPQDRLDVLNGIERINAENRIKTGKLPRLALIKKTYMDSDFVDITLVKKSSDWLFHDEVLYRESIVGFALTQSELWVALAKTA